MNTFLKVLCGAVALSIVLFFVIPAINQYIGRVIQDSTDTCFYFNTVRVFCFGKMPY